MFKHMHYEKQLVVLRKAVRVLINDFILRLMCVYIYICVYVCACASANVSEKD